MWPGWFQRPTPEQFGVKVLQHALQAAQCLPKRTFAKAEEFALYLEKEAELIFDGVEQRIQRPGEQATQKDFYSGKKSVIPSRPSL